MPTYTRFRDIPQFTRDAAYQINVPWTSIERTLEEFSQSNGIDLDPDFQRAHVWTEIQQIRFIEYILRDGKTGRQIMFNQSGWNRSGTDRGEPVVLVDGKQRLQAVRRFLNSEISAFGTLFNDFEDELRIMGPQFVFFVNDLPTRAEVLQWYIDLNAGGVAHTDEEIEKVRKLLEEENHA